MVHKPYIDALHCSTGNALRLTYFSTDVVEITLFAVCGRSHKSVHFEGILCHF